MYDLSLAYSPGVAAPCRKICANPDDVYIYTVKGNLVAIVTAVQRLAPVFGGINLEDIAAPRCFEIEKRLREALDIPVFHDDQHGTAIVVAAGLIRSWWGKPSAT